MLFVIQQNSSGVWSSNVFTQTFSYDRWGNRGIDVANTTANVPGVTRKTFTINPANNRLTAIDGVAVGYDSAGNQTTISTSGQPDYELRDYDAENRMTRATKSGVTSYYHYDGSGKRVRRVIGGAETWQVYGFDGELIAEYNVSGTFNGSNAPAAVSPAKEYGYRSGKLLVVWDGSQGGNAAFRWLVTDHLGSTRMEADLSGSLTSLKRHDYLPFGEELVATTGAQRGGIGYEPPVSNVRQKFGAKERDTETGLDFFEARYCASVQGRFSRIDPDNEGAKPDYPQSWNGYSYVINNPLKYSDPDGLSVLICDTQGHCQEISDDDARKYTFNKTYQSQNGFHTKGDGKIYNTQGQVIGTYTNLGDDRWNNWQKATVRETARQLDNPATKIKAAINVLSGKTGTQSLTSRVTSIAEKFRLYQCEECAEAIITELQKEGIHGEVLEVKARGSDFMLTEKAGWGQSITTNGRHVGVKIGDTVYDNIYTEGIPVQEWVNKFEARNGIKMTTKKTF